MGAVGFVETHFEVSSGQWVYNRQTDMRFLEVGFVKTPL